MIVTKPFNDLVAFFIFFKMFRIYEGQVLYPPESVTVCNGSVLELRCTTAGEYLKWSFLTREPNARPISQTLSTYSETSHLQINSTTFTFSRISALNSLPLMSMLLITPIHTDLNDTEFYCINVETSDSSSTFVYVVNEDSFSDQSESVNVSEQFEINLVTVAFKLIAQDRLIDVIITPHPAFTLKEATKIQLQVFYNTVYNVTVIGTSPVCRKNVTTLIGLHYANCGNPSSLQVDHSVTVTGYIDPALPGSKVLFNCPPTLVLSGPNSSTCMGNEQWEPDPREAKCNYKEITTQQDHKIAIYYVAIAAVITFLFTSIVCFITGCLCHYAACHKQKPVASNAEFSRYKSSEHDVINVAANPAYESV